MLRPWLTALLRMHELRACREDGPKEIALFCCAGDSLMRQQFASLACLLKGVSASGKSARWDLSDIKLQGDYQHRWGDHSTSVAKQFVGEFTLNNGAQVRPWALHGTFPVVCTVVKSIPLG